MENFKEVYMENIMRNKNGTETGKNIFSFIMIPWNIHTEKWNF